MLAKLYLLYGVMVLSGIGVAQYRGYSLDRISQIKNVPRSIRDNPGAYRSIYSSYHHYTGGK